MYLAPIGLEDYLIPEVNTKTKHSKSRDAVNDRKCFRFESSLAFVEVTS